MALARALVPSHIRCRARRCPQPVHLPAHRRSRHSHRVRARAEHAAICAVGITCRFMAWWFCFICGRLWRVTVACDHVASRVACAPTPQSYFTRISSNSSAQLRKTWQHICRAVWLSSARDSLGASKLNPARSCLFISCPSRALASHLFPRHTRIVRSHLCCSRHADVSPLLPSSASGVPSSQMRSLLPHCSPQCTTLYY